MRIGPTRLWACVNGISTRGGGGRGCEGSSPGGGGVRAAGQSCMPVLSAEVMSSHPSWLRSKF